MACKSDNQDAFNAISFSEKKSLTLAGCEKAMRTKLPNVDGTSYTNRLTGKIKFSGDLDFYISDLFSDSSSATLNLIDKIYPYQIQMHNLHDVTDVSSAGVYIYSYTGNGQNKRTNFSLLDKLKSADEHSWRLNSYSDYTLFRSFLHNVSVNPEYEYYLALNERFFNAENESLLRTLKAPVIEYYLDLKGDNYRQAEIYRVNCYINIDDTRLTEGFLNECLIRAMGLPAPRRIHTDLSESADEVSSLDLFYNGTRQKYSKSVSLLRDLSCIQYLYN